MTKLTEWLLFGLLLNTLWLLLLKNRFNHAILEEYSLLIIYLPVILVFVFGAYAATVVLWRVYKFNDCEDAAVELKKQIKEAKADLRARGFQFVEEKT